MQLFKEALGVLEKSKEFKDWKKKNPNAYLSHGFTVIEQDGDEWKIGYYQEKNNKITSFNIGEKITVEPEEEVFKKDKTKVGALDLKKIRLDLSKAVETAVNLQKEEFSTESPTKIIAIVQNLKVGQVWNITFITQSFNSLNFKIKSDSGKILEKKLSPLFELGKSV